MADPTPVAMRLAEVSLDASLNEHVLDIDEDGKVTRVDQLAIAHALDDAGVREAVSMLDHCIRSCMALGSTFDGPGKRFAAAMQQDLSYTLSALTGTQETSDGD
jgi:hypothetical protein